MTLRVIREFSSSEQNPRRPVISLRLALILPFLLLTVGTVGLIEYLCIRNGQQTVQDLAEQLITEVSNQVNLYLGDYLETPQLINRLNANAVRLGQIDITNSEGLKRHFVQQLQVFDEISRIHFSNPQGGYVAAGNDERGLTVALTNNFDKGTLRVSSVDSQGNPIKLSVERQNYDASKRPFYQSAVTAGQPTWSPVYVYVPASRGLGIAASYPLYNQAHQLRGVLSSDLTLVAISKFLGNLKIGTHGEAFIIDRSGQLVASSTPERPFFTSADGQQTRQLKATESQEPVIRLTAQQLLQVGDLTKLKAGTQLDFEIEGKRHFLQVTSFQDKFGLDWLIVVTVPASDFTARIDANTRATQLLVAAALLGAIALGLLLTRWISRPIQQLGQASRALAAGEWYQTFKHDSLIAELQVLNGSFVQMAKQLQQSFEQARVALEESEEKFTKVFRTCPDPIGIVTLEGRYIDVNDAFVELFGYSREEVMGRTAAEIGHWVSLEQRQQYAQMLQKGERVHNLEFTFYDKSGKRITVLFSAESSELQGQPYIVGIAKEITDRKQTELELKRQQELRETLYNESTDALFLVNPETLLITDCNRRAVELFEAESKAELIGITGAVLQRHPFTSQETNGIVAEMNQKGFWSREVEYVTRKGNFFWGNLAAKPVQIANQAVHLVRVTDITERKQAEAALQQSEARFQKIAAASPAQIYILVYSPAQHEMRYEYISTGIREIQELEPEQVLADPLLTYNQVHLEDRDTYNRLTLYSLRTLQPFSHEWRIITPSGKVKWVRANSRPERRENGEIAWYGVLLDVTDRKQAEEALRQSEATKNQILNAIPDLLIWMTADGTYIDLIEGHELSSFIPACEAIGKNLFDVLPIELAHRRMHATQQALQTGKVQVYEHEVIVRGKICSEEVRVVAVGADKVLTIIRDITKRKRAEAELEAQRAFLRQLINVIPNPVFAKDPEGRFIAVNQEFAAIYNLSVDEILGKQETDLTGPFSQTQVEEFLATNRAVMLTRQLIQSPPQQLDTQGKRRWFQTLLSPFIDLEGQVRGVVGNSVDVTNLKQIEETLQRQNQALRESEERFRSAFHDAPIGMALIGLNDRWLKVNPMLCDMLDCSEIELMSMQASALVHSEDLKKLERCIEQVLASENRSAQVELRYCCTEGRIVWGLISLSLVRDAEKQPLYYVAQIQDITEQQAIDRMKNEFISIVSHELRTPLTAIRGFLGLLNTGIYDNRPDKAKRMIEQSLTNSDRLVRLVNDILDLERLSSGRVQLVTEVCPADDLMQRAVAGVQSIGDAALVTFSIVPTRAQVWAAPDSIIQTLTNLLSNAIKFSPPHSVVTLSAQIQPDCILFEVKDRGRGIPADKLESIFKRFQQVDVSDARQKGGTGLGLAICQSIVQQHGGNIWAESTLGEGSRFYFTLPLPSEAYS